MKMLLLQIDNQFVLSQGKILFIMLNLISKTRAVDQIFYKQYLFSFVFNEILGLI